MAILLSSQHQVQFCDTILGRIAAEVRGDILRKKRIDKKRLLIDFKIALLKVLQFDFFFQNSGLISKISELFSDKNAFFTL